MMTKFNVKVISDNVCPWCFVGKRNLESAMQKYSATQPTGAAPSFEVSWKPFFLNVASPETSEEPIAEYLEKKYGKGAGSRMSTALEKAGELTGINFNKDRRVHNTIRSHRLVRLASEQGKGGDMIEQLFHGYFEEGRNIADVDVLLDLAKKADVECSKDYLQGKEGKDEVLYEYEKAARSEGVSGVPYFVLSREGSRATLPLSGAQPPEAFIEAFEALS
ncbi:unnamed protein product [Sphacelaria rigidula]